MEINQEQLEKMSPSDINELLCGKCLENLYRAKQLYEEGEYTEAEPRIRNTEMIIGNMIEGLSGIEEPVAEELIAMYHWCLNKTEEIRIHKQALVFDKVIQVFEEEMKTIQDMKKG